MCSLAARINDPDTGEETRNNLDEQLQLIYQRIIHRYPFLSCMGVATPGISLAYSTEAPTSACGDMRHALLSQALEVITSGQEHKGQDNLLSFPMTSRHLEQLASRAGFHSTLGLPLVAGSRKLGYIFFGAREEDRFTPEVVEQMNVYSRVIAQLLAGNGRPTENLRSAVASVLQLNNASESESPAHLRRVAMYSRLIAENCADKFDLSQDWIEHLEMFAPLHDIGKVFIPEHILMKPERLTDEEFQQVKAHTLKGRDLIDHMISCFGYQNTLHHTDMLRNIITFHHEAIDGSGYPYGLRGQEIPLEARIVAAADILDALLTRRVYKQAWSMEKTMRTLWSMAGTRLDADFVEILSRNQDELIAIRARCERELAS